jgi:heme-degrading monooxygenase HmoA
MYAQITHIRVPMNKMGELREVIETKYLPVVRARPGFLAGYLLEQVDDRDNAQLVLFWDSHAAVENFNRTGMLQASVYGLASDIPGVTIHREGFTVPLSVRGALAELAEVGV